MQRLLPVHYVLVLLVGLLAACATPSSPSTPTPPPALQGDTLSGRLLFSRDDGIWLWEGRTARRLINPPVTQPAFNPTGNQIACIVLHAGASDLVIIDTAGAMLAQLTRNEPAAPPGSIERVYSAKWAFYPTWLPDGSGVLVSAQIAPPVGDPPADAPLAIVRYDVNGLQQVVFSDANAHLGKSVVLPSGDLIVVRTPLGSDGQQQLFRISNNQATPLPGAPTPAYDPALSPDGTWLVFAVGIDGGSDLYAMPATGGSPVRLTDIGSARSPAFAPDGKTLAFLAIPPGGRGFDLYLAEVTTAGDTLQLGTSRRLSTDFAINADGGLTWAP